jgi:hypothetical protein
MRRRRRKKRRFSLRQKEKASALTLSPKRGISVKRRLKNCRKMDLRSLENLNLRLKIKKNCSMLIISSMGTNCIIITMGLTAELIHKINHRHLIIIKNS